MQIEDRIKQGADRFPIKTHVDSPFRNEENLDFAIDHLNYVGSSAPYTPDLKIDGNYQALNSRYYSNLKNERSRLLELLKNIKSFNNLLKFYPIVRNPDVRAVKEDIDAFRPGSGDWWPKLYDPYYEKKIYPFQLANLEHKKIRDAYYDDLDKLEKNPLDSIPKPKLRFPNEDTANASSFQNYVLQNKLPWSTASPITHHLNSAVKKLNDFRNRNYLKSLDRSIKVDDKSDDEVIKLIQNIEDNKRSGTPKWNIGQRTISYPDKYRFGIFDDPKLQQKYEKQFGDNPYKDTPEYRQLPERINKLTGAIEPKELYKDVKGLDVNNEIQLDNFVNRELGTYDRFYDYQYKKNPLYIERVQKYNDELLKHELTSASKVLEERYPVRRPWGHARYGPNRHPFIAEGKPDADHSATDSWKTIPGEGKSIGSKLPYTTSKDPPTREEAKSNVTYSDTYNDPNFAKPSLGTSRIYKPTPKSEPNQVESQSNRKPNSFFSDVSHWVSNNPGTSIGIGLGALGAGYGAYKYLTRNKKKSLQKVPSMMNEISLEKKAWQNHYVDEYWKDVFPKLIATGAIGGGVLRGGIGLLELLKHNMRPGPEPVEPTVLDIPYRPVPQDQPDVKKKPLLSFQKTSANWGWGGTLLGAGAKNLWEVPIAYPASIAGVAGGGILGYKLIDHLVKRQKRKMVDEELDDAKDQYHKAMMLQFDPLSGNKVKSIKAAELSEKSNIDKCLDESTDIGKDLTKLATGVIDAAEGAGRMGLGAYTALASLLALGTGYATHKYMEPPYHQSELIRKQIDDRASNPLQPSDTFARLVPVDERNRPIDMNKKKNQLLYGPTEGATPLNKESLDLRVNKFVKQLVGRK